MNFGLREPDFGFYAKPTLNSVFLDYLCSILDEAREQISELFTALNTLAH
jgi:hypothetical protein